MKFILIKILTIILFTSGLGIQNVIGQQNNLAKVLVNLLDMQPPDTTTIKKMLNGSLSEKWLFLVNYRGINEIDLTINFYEPQNQDPIFQVSNVRTLPYLKEFDEVKSNWGIRCISSELPYSLYNLPNNIKIGYLSYLSLGDRNGNDLIPVHVKIGKDISPQPPLGNWLCRPSIGRRKCKISPLTAFFAGSTISTFFWYRNEDNIFNNYYSDYKDANDLVIVSKYRISAEKADTRRCIAKRVFISAGFLCLISLVNDLFFQ